MNAATASQPAQKSSVFDLRHNWLHLTRRPGFQEPVLDGIRAIALLWVLAVHLVFFHLGVFPEQAVAVFTNPLTGWIMRGDLALDLFFVISGFLMGSMLFEEYRKSANLQFSRFYVRRFLRLIPVYVVAMLLGLYFCHDLPGMDKWGNAETIWANLLYVNNFVPIEKQYMGWCWSLAVEEQFYILLPAAILLFMAFGKGRPGLLFGMVLLSGIVRYTVIHVYAVVPPPLEQAYTPQWSHWFNTEYDKFYTRFGGLMVGVTAAYLTTYRLPELKRFFARTGWVTFLALLSLAAIVHIVETPMGSPFFDKIPPVARETWWALHHDVLSAATAFLILAAIHTPALFGGALRSFLVWKGFYPLAQLSYSCYLMHEMVIIWLYPRLAPMLFPVLGPWATMAADAAVALLITFAIVSILYVTIERPSMRLRSHPAVTAIIEVFSRRSRPKVAAEA